MFFRSATAIAAIAVVTAACASIIEGRSQHISVNTTPAGADCGLYREQGMRLATVQNTPGQALVEKTKNDIWIVCVKPGYEQATFLNHSGVAGASFANVIGGVFTLGIATAIGAAVDSSNGSDNLYESPVNITMAASPPDRAAASAALPQTFEAPKSAQRGQQGAVPVASVDPASPVAGPGPSTTSQPTGTSASVLAPAAPPAEE